MDKFTQVDKDKLLNAISTVEITAQNMQENDSLQEGEWSEIETEAANLRDLIEELEVSK